MRATSAARGSRQFRIAIGALIGAILGLGLGIFARAPTEALAALCGTKPALPPGGCQTNWVCDTDSGRWAPVYAAADTACNDSNSCTANDVCDGAGACGGTVSCPPAVPGAT